jgi:hypothetical protein
MGRYVYSRSPEIEYEYKFAVAEQPSNFGELLDEYDLKNTTVSRYCGDFGEYVELYFHDCSEAIKELLNHANNDADTNNRNMILKLVKAIPCKTDLPTLTFFVEY